MVDRLATWAISGTASGAATRARTTRRSAASCCAAPSSACGRSCASASSSRIAKPGKAEETVRRQLERTLAEMQRVARRVPDDLVIAYEPVWAIGTGLTARGSDAAAMAERHPATPRRWRRAGRRCARARSSTAAASPAATIDEFLAEPDHRRRAGRRREPQGRRDGRHRRPCRPDGRRPRQRDSSDRSTAAARRSSSSTASASGHDRCRRRDRRCPHARLARATRAVAALAARGVRRGRRPARRADGQQRGRPPQHRRRPAGAPGPAAHRRRHRRRLLLRATPALLAAIERSASRGTATAPGRPDRARAASTRTIVTPSRSRDWHTATVARDVVVHGLLDGRDTPPRSADDFVPDFEARLADAHPGARIATIGGRYFAMDRDKRWERTQARLRRDRPRPRAASCRRRCRRSLDGYARGENDEFVQPTVIEGVDGTRPRWRRRDPLQLPGRPGAPADPRPGRRRRVRRHRLRPRRAGRATCTS